MRARPALRSALWALIVLSILIVVSQAIDLALRHKAMAKIADHETRIRRLEVLVAPEALSRHKDLLGVMIQLLEEREERSNF